MNTYTCDKCGQEFNENGMIEWKQNGGLRLVHNNGKCQYNNDQIDGDLPVESFEGPNGLVTLLSFLQTDKLPKNEIIEMIQRIHVPGYEQARHHFRDAIREYVIEPNMPDGFYFQNDIKAVIEYRKSR